MEKHHLSGLIEVREGAHTGSIDSLTLPKHTLALRHEDRYCVDRWEGELMRYRSRPANSMLFIPGDSSFQSQLENRRYSGTMILLDHALFSSAAAGAIDYSRISFHCQDVSGPMTLSLVQAIRQFTVQDDLMRWPILVESASIALAASLIRDVSPNASTAPIQSPGLSNDRKRRVVEFIEANLSRPVTIAEMAAVANMSQFHFVRSFKKALGETPLRYVVRRRLDGAMRLLRSGRGSLADIALQSGYSSQSHMNTVFKKVLGVTPGGYRHGVVGALAAWLTGWGEVLLPVAMAW